MAETNKELLLSAGWTIEDGWLCNPKLNGEKVFEVEHVELMDRYELFMRISNSAFNAGSRWQREDSKDYLKRQLQSLAKKVDKW